MRADLHTHSTVSDGTTSPARLVADAARAGLDVVALTDHDSTAGWDDAARAAREHSIALIRGLELSTRAEGHSVHVLAYLPCPDDPALSAQTARIRESRDGRARRIVERLSADYAITWDDVLAQTEPGTTIGRPHIADALTAAGITPDRSAAFATLLHPHGPYYVPHHAPDTAEAVRLVRGAGGVPVLAHPGATARGYIVGDETIESLAAAGLLGLEVDHRDNDPVQRARLRALAARLGLFVTGSSDYHGAGKPNRLGENTTDSMVVDMIEQYGKVDVVR